MLIGREIGNRLRSGLVCGNGNVDVDVDILMLFFFFFFNHLCNEAIERSKEHDGAYSATPPQYTRGKTFLHTLYLD